MSFAPVVQRWSPLLAALALNALLLVPLLRSGADAQRSQRRRLPVPTTPELVRWSRSAAQQQGATLPVNLAGLALPPPPPDLLPPALAPRPQAGHSPSSQNTSPGNGKGLAAATAAPAQASGDPAPDPRREEPIAPALLERLWNAARPPQQRPPGLAGLPAEIDLRQLPLAQLRESGVEEVPRQALRSGQAIWLLWSDGPLVWLLRMPLA